MCSFLLSNAQAIVNSVGLLFDIVGAWFVAWEIVNQHEGAKTQVTAGVVTTNYLGSNGTPVIAGQRSEETQEYKAWELKKYKYMKLGIFLLTIGFLLQFVSNWIPKIIAWLT